MAASHFKCLIVVKILLPEATPNVNVKLEG